MGQSLRSGKHIVWNTGQHTSCAVAAEGEGVAGGEGLEFNVSCHQMTPYCQRRPVERTDFFSGKFNSFLSVERYNQ